MKNPRFSTRQLALAAIVGAAYAALTIGLAPISYGPAQFRISEVLCILPYFLPCTAWGLFVGCAVSNLIGAGVWDIVFGSLTTLAAALLTEPARGVLHTLKGVVDRHILRHIASQGVVADDEFLGFGLAVAALEDEALAVKQPAAFKSEHLKAGFSVV